MVQDRFVGRVQIDSTSVSHDTASHSREGLVGGLWPPESSARHHGDLGSGERLE
jgi:hypothetical protein